MSLFLTHLPSLFSSAVRGGEGLFQKGVGSGKIPPPAPASQKDSLHLWDTECLFQGKIILILTETKAGSNFPSALRRYQHKILTFFAYPVCAWFQILSDYISHSPSPNLCQFSGCGRKEALSVWSPTKVMEIRMTVICYLELCIVSKQESQLYFSPVAFCAILFKTTS